MQIAMTMNLRAMLGLATRCHDDPILCRFAHVNGKYTANHTATGITHASYGNYATPFYWRTKRVLLRSARAPVMADALRNAMGPTGTRCDDRDVALA